MQRRQVNHWLKWFEHVPRSAGLAKTILQRTVQGGRRSGKQKKRWENNISEWTGFKFCDALGECKNKIEGKGLFGPWRPNGHHDYIVKLVGARCKRWQAMQFNPSSPKSDQHQISPCKINAL